MDFQSRFQTIGTSVLGSLKNLNENVEQLFSETSKKTQGVAKTALTQEPPETQKPEELLERVKLISLPELERLSRVATRQQKVLASCRREKTEVENKIKELTSSSNPKSKFLIAEQKTKLEGLKTGIRHHKIALGRTQTSILLATQEIQDNFNKIISQMDEKTPQKSSWISKAKAEMKSITETLENLKTINQLNPHSLDKMEGDKIYQQIKETNKTEKEIIFKLLVHLAKKDPELLGAKIHECDLTEDDKFELAKIVAERSAKALSYSIRNYGFADVNKRFELAKICVINHPGPALSMLSHFDIHSLPNATFDIARIAITKDPDSTASMINRLKMPPQQFLQLVMLLAKENPNALGTNFKAWGIKEEQTRFLILKGIAPVCPDAICRYFKNFDINDSANQLEIAKLCAAKDGRAVSKYFSNFGKIDTPEKQLAIARIAVAQDPGKFSKFLSNYDLINDPSDLADLAMIASKKSGLGISLWIKNYISKGLTDQKALVKIAENSFRSNTFISARHFDDFGIKDPLKRYELALIAAKLNGFAVSENISKFKLTEPSHLIRIAEICARQSGIGTAKNISEFGITNQRDLVRIAKICARENGGGLAIYFKNFGITDPKDRFEIAKIALQQNFPNLNDVNIRTDYTHHAVDWISNFDISSEEDSIELAKEAARNDPLKLLTNIKQFNIENENTQLLIEKIAGVQFALDFYSKTIVVDMQLESRLDLAPFLFVFPNSNKILRQLQTLISLNDHNIDDLERIHQNTIQLAHHFLGVAEEDLKLFNEVFKNEENPYQKEKMLYQLLPMLLAMHIDPAIKQLLKDPINRNILNSLVTTNHPLLNLLIANFIRIHDKDHLDAKNAWLEFRKTIKSEDPGHFAFLPLALAATAGESSALIPICQQWLNIFRTNEDFYSNFKNAMPPIELLVELSQTPQEILSIEEKSKIMASLYSFKDNPTQLKKMCSIVRDLIRFKKPDFFADLSSPQAIEKNLQSLFKQEFNLEDKENFAEEYLKTFGSFRMPEAIMTYAGSLKVLAPEQKELLNLFVSSVLDGTFPEMRYTTYDNPHLNRIFAGNPKLKEEWAKGETITAKNLVFARSPDTPRENNFQPAIQAVLRREIEEQRKLGNEFQYDYLRQAMDLIGNQNISDADKRIRIDGLREKAKEAVKLKTQEIVEAKGNKGLLKTLGEERTLLGINIFCLELLNPSHPPGKIETLLKNLQQIVPKKSAFSDEIVNLMKQLFLTSKASKLDGLTLIDTDEPCNLLLSGTEVDTCQNVDGIAEKNASLQRTLCDGKIRMIGLINDQKEIVARVLVKLLWDDVAKKPVMFVERYYAINANTTYAKLVLAMCKRRANALNLPICLSQDYFKLVPDKEKEVYPNPLFSYQGKGSDYTPEYVDALKGGTMNAYKIPNSFLLK